MSRQSFSRRRLAKALAMMTPEQHDRFLNLVNDQLIKLVEDNDPNAKVASRAHILNTAVSIYEKLAGVQSTAARQMETFERHRRFMVETDQIINRAANAVSLSDLNLAREAAIQNSGIDFRKLAEEVAKDKLETAETVKPEEPKE